MNAQLELRRIWCSPLKNLSASFATGLHVVVGSELDGTAALIELCAGVRAPSRGRVDVAGKSPHADSDLRARTASLLASEADGAGGRVSDLLGAVGIARGLSGPLVLPPGERDPDASAPLSSLTRRERRRLALRIALSHPAPLVVALHDPLDAGGDDALPRIRQLAEDAVVVVATPSLNAARRLGGTLHALERGVLSRHLPHAWPAATTPGLAPELIVDCDNPRELLRELAREAAVTRCHLDVALAPERLSVSGSDPESLSLAVCRAAERASVAVFRLAPAAQDLEVLHAASAGLASAAYRAAKRHGGGPPRTPGAGGRQG